MLLFLICLALIFSVSLGISKLPFVPAQPRMLIKIILSFLSTIFALCAGIIGYIIIIDFLGMNITGVPQVIGASLVVGLPIAFNVFSSVKPRAMNTRKLGADSKVCPFCAETIKDKAIICRFCQRDLPILQNIQAHNLSMVGHPIPSDLSAFDKGPATKYSWANSEEAVINVKKSLMCYKCHTQQQSLYYFKFFKGEDGVSALCVTCVKQSSPESLKLLGQEQHLW